MDYSELGFKAGLEIHQQLDTRKLFSNTPSFLRSDEPDFEISRRLHAVAGEGGEIDEAVKHEAGIGREFVYQGYKDGISLVELDEEPPEMIDDEALSIGMQVALLLNCEIIPLTQIMRKTVIDGSNTSGFQRTVLIAQNGYVETSFGKVKVDTIALEEDAARIISRDDEKSVYRLDRLGIPLIEIATSPDMKNPEQVKEVALYLGDVLRACKVKRGIGTIRQDVNVSVKGHPRVEIKGFQDVKMFVPTIEKEVERQVGEKGVKKGEVRRAEANGTTSFLRPMPGAARMYPETDLPLLKISRQMINDVKGNLPKLRSEVRGELKDAGLSSEMINLILKEGKLEELKELKVVYDDVNLIAKMLVLWVRDISSKLGKSVASVEKKLSVDVLGEILENLKEGKIGKNDVLDVMNEIVKGKSVEDALKVEKVSLDKVEEFVAKIVKEKPGLNVGGYMGLIMKEFKGKVSGKEIMEILKRYVK